MENNKKSVIESRAYSRDDEYRFKRLLVRRSRAVGSQPAVYELSITDSYGKEEQIIEQSVSREEILDKYLLYANNTLMAEGKKRSLWETSRKTNPIITTEIYFSDDEQSYQRITVEKLSETECYFIVEKSHSPNPDCGGPCSHTEICFSLTEVLMCYDGRIHKLL